MANSELLVSTGFELPGYRITKHCGIVRGLVVRVPTIKQGFLGALKSIVGGQIGSYREMCELARKEAYLEMIEHAQSIGANAIVGMRYDSSELSGITEVLCYGTAVIISE